MDNLNVADTYFLKAWDNYGYNSTEVVENINYALSYDEEHAPTWCLKGRLFMDELKNFQEAKRCFENAIFYNPTYIETYKYYTLLLIWTGEFEKAQIIINKGKRVKGMPLSYTIHRSALIHEFKGNIGEAIRIMKNGQMFSLNQPEFDFFHNEIKRLNRKVSQPVKRKVKKKTKKRKPSILQMAGRIITWLF